MKKMIKFVKPTYSTKQQLKDYDTRLSIYLNNMSSSNSMRINNFCHDTFQEDLRKILSSYLAHKVKCLGQQKVIQDLPA